ncbi:hypothetical protein [Micromonospora sp. NPDC051296]|uniref:hypothetical protein n=1 Tax=Micromonospora sp. NPDC051296 TaxID=3155046 RepID=UPI00342A7DDB
MDIAALSVIRAGRRYVVPVGSRRHRDRPSDKRWWAAARSNYLVDAVFNYPALAEAYKVAALDAASKIRNITRING